MKSSLPRTRHLFSLASSTGWALAVLIGVGCTSPGRPAPLAIHNDLFNDFNWAENRDQDWFRRHIPFLATPDPRINETYYYRWELLTKHLVYGSPEVGYTFTEFMDRPFWSGAYGAISCPLGHQFSEIRWLKDHRILDDFARYWIDAPGAEPRSYSNWYADALWQAYEVNGQRDWILSMLPYMEAQYEGWMAERWDPDHRMFMWNGMRDGMETNINSRQTQREFDGAFGYRPTLNSYLYADMRAIAKTASLAGDAPKAAEFVARAFDLRERIVDELWDPEREFFFHQSAGDHPSGVEALSLTHETGQHAGSPFGRELIGYVPWQFGVPTADHSAAWQFLMERDRFLSDFGPTTVEQRDPLFLVSPRCCVWSGQSWPYATTQTLAAMANLLNDYEQEQVEAEDYFDLFEIYTSTHWRDGKPYIAESADPFTGSWAGSDLPNHSEHYLHSGYIDLLITGLLGIRPSASDTLVVNPLIPPDWDWFALGAVEYHGLYLDVVWDRTGRKFGHGQGLTIWAQGELVAHRDDMGRLEGVLPPPRPIETAPRRSNVAVNNGTLWPRVTASFAAPEHPPEFAVDGSYWYDEVPTNRWTTIGSKNETDWIQVEFGVGREIDEVKLYWLDDGDSTTAPADHDIELLTPDGWVAPTARSMQFGRAVGHRANRSTFRPVSAEAVRVTMTHETAAASGLTEFEVWSPTPAESLAVAPGSPNLARGQGVSIRSSDGRSGDALAVLTDGRFGFTTYQSARWEAEGDHPIDYVEFEFDTPVDIGTADVFLWGDPPRYLPTTEPDATLAPTGFWIERVDEIDDSKKTLDPPQRQPESYPETPQAMARNRLVVNERGVTRFRVHFHHARPATTGVTEIALWPPEQ